jgi:hypothetical protein
MLGDVLTAAEECGTVFARRLEAQKVKRRVDSETHRSGCV